MKIYSAQFKGTTTVSTGSNVSLTGSFSGSIYGFDDTIQYSSSVSSDLSNLESKSASVDISISNINSVTASNIARLSNLETKSASVDISISNINQYTGSNDTKWTTLTNVTSSLIAATGSYATTGSNSFFGTQTFSGSVYIANDLIVQGSSSIQYISASSVSIGTNIVQLNTANPSVRFAGLTIIDSGSIGGSGSFLYDSVHDEFIFVHRGNGTNVTSSHFVLGPETYDSLGSETYLTTNILPKGTGKEHLIDSCIFDNGTTTCIKNNLVIGGTTCFQNNIAISGFLSFNVGAGVSNFAARDNCDTLIYSNTGKLKFTDVTGTSNYMTITPNGNVGIGVSCPTSTYGFSRSLVVSNPTNAEISLEATTCSKVLSIGVTDGFNYFQTTSGNGYDFQIGGGSKMRMTSSGITTFVCQVCISVARTNGANSTALILQDNVTGIQTPGFGLRLVYQSNGTGVQSVIGLENGNTGTNNESQISFYTQNTAGGLSKRLLIDASGIACFSGVVCAASFGQIKGDSTNDVHSFTNDNAGNTHFCNRYGRLLTSNGSNWAADGRDPIMALVGSYSCTSRGLSIGLALHNDNNTTNAYSPMIAFSALSNSSGYNSTYASIMGKKTGTASGLDTNWNKGELHFYAHGENYIADTPTMILSSVGVTKPFQPFVYGGLASDQTISTSNPTKVNFVANAGHFGCNVGSNWNNSTNQFTAPITGVYLVNLSGYWSSINMINQFAAFVNNARKVSIPTGYCTNIAGGSMMVPMASGETMDFRVYNDVGTGTLYQNVYHTFFSIYLLG